MNIINLEGVGFSPQSPSPGSTPATCLMFIVIKLANCSVLLLNVGDSVHYFRNTPIATPTSWPDHLKCACYGPATYALRTSIVPCIFCHRGNEL